MSARGLGRRSTTASRSWSASTARRWSSSTRGAWPSAWRGTCRSGSAKSTSPSHHGSLAREQRLDAEQRLKRGELKALVATASLELGIDIGDVDLVCQIGSPRSIAAFLQRVGRSGHAVGGVPKGRLFPLSRDELVECAALLDARAPRRARPPAHARTSRSTCWRSRSSPRSRCGEWRRGRAVRAGAGAPMPYRGPDARRVRRGRAHAGRRLHTRRGRRAALSASRRGQWRAARPPRRAPDRDHLRRHDSRHRRLRRCVLEPQAQVVGTVNEDFAVESLAGDIFQLGNTSYRILRVERGRVRVEDAQGQPPTIPFWLGEAPGRSDELSASRCRGCAKTSAARLDADRTRRRARLADRARRARAEPRPSRSSTTSRAAKAALGVLPTQQTVVFERFFDETGGTQLVIHSPFGSRINRAWGLALRKRFCRKFNFELQAAATEDAIVLSLSTSHSFPLEEVARYLHSKTVRAAAGAGAARCADVRRALALERDDRAGAAALSRRQQGAAAAAAHGSRRPAGGGVPRSGRLRGEHRRRARDSRSSAGAADDRRLPARGDGHRRPRARCCARIESGEIDVVARDLTEPSPLALEILAARPYAFLDDAPLEERRTQAVMARRWLDAGNARPTSAGSIPTRSRACAKRRGRQPRNADELHDALLGARLRHAARGRRACRRGDAAASSIARRPAAPRDLRCRRVGRACRGRAAAGVRRRLPGRRALSRAIDAPAEYRKAVDARRSAASRSCAAACEGSGR